MGNISDSGIWISVW